MQQHIQQMPAPVVAALGRHLVTTTKLAAEAATTRSRYVAAPRFRSLETVENTRQLNR
ncbi:hypothetical protein [Nocardia sp. NPDC046763]|uniref:hypothetical protein n=1 Tax=Nocardia sp. NPDC046763 TaxID=3155256 RepID=UPI00340D5880